MNKLVRQYVGMTIGIVVAATALNMFLIPNKVAAGGISGLATVIYHLSGWPVGVIMLVFNIPLFFLGIKVLGTRYGLNTLYGAAAYSLSIDLLAPYTPVLTNDLLLSSLYGGVVSGIGMGLVFRFKGNTAGTAMAAAIVNKLYGISVGQALLIADFIVVALAGVVFKSPELALYATISIFVTSQIIDLVQEGPSTSKAFFILTEQPQDIADCILYEIDRGVTFLQGRGGFTGQARELLLCVVSTSEVTRLKELVYQKDQRAFVIVTDVNEVLGEGFAAAIPKK